MPSGRQMVARAALALALLGVSTAPGCGGDEVGASAPGAPEAGAPGRGAGAAAPAGQAAGGPGAGSGEVVSAPPANGAARGGALPAGRPPSQAADGALPATGGTARYVAGTTCAACHPEEAAAHAVSHHALAMQHADEHTVLGDFDDAVFEQDGVTTRFVRDGEAFVVQTQGPDGAMARYEVGYVFGVEPLQQVLLPLDRGRLQAFQIAWDTVRGEWFSLQPDGAPPAGDPFHWSGPFQRWNAMCAECHSTDLRRAYDDDTDSYATTWHGVSVGCQACHGPGSEHVAWAEAVVARRAAAEGSGAAGGGAARDGWGADAYEHAPPRGGFPVDPGDATQVDQCARCHSRRERVVTEDGPGAPFLDQFMPARLREGLYHADGQVLDEVYVWGSFVQSPMYREGVRCGDCHEPHRLTLRAEGNAVCTQCHNDQRSDPRFGTLPLKAYDTPAHHHHDAGTDGAACVNCHMPARDYMVVDPRRDHSFRVPRPDLAVTLGVPEPCTACHADRDAAWAEQTLRGWAADAGVETRLGTPHFATTLHAARSGSPSATAALVALAGDETQPPLVRATALDHLGERGEGVEALRDASTSDDGLMRVAVAGALDGLTPPDALAIGVPLLSDPLRSVRTEAARALSGAWPVDRPEPDGFGAALAAALAEFTAVERAKSDLPGGAFRLGIVADRRGDGEAAAASYRRALERDPWFLPARFNLVNLLNRMGRNDQALAALEEGLALSPEEGELHYSLGLLLAEMGDLPRARDALAAAVERMPDRPRVRFNLAQARMALGDAAGAEADLLAVYALDPDDADAVGSLLGVALQRDDVGAALRWAYVLRGLVPPDPQLAALVARLEARRGE